MSTDSTDELPARENFAFQLLRLARLWRWWLDQRLIPEDLSQAGWITLFYLSRNGEGMTQRELADYIRIQGPTLVRHLDNLEEKGLAERRQKEGDRRARTVHLTEAAHPVLDRISETAVELRNELLSGINDEELQVCVDVFARIARNSERTTRLAGRGTPDFTG